MLIKWFGHACFFIDSSEFGISILTDPFDKSVGYPLPDVSPDLITESHQHFDHNAHDLLKGNFKVLKEEGIFEESNLKIKAIRSYHDESMGSERGMNLIFKFEFPNGISIAHLGDIGHVIDDKILKELLPVDIILIPVGGKFTIGPDEAVEVCKLTNPKVVIPMHYKTKYINFPIKSVDDFEKIAFSNLDFEIIHKQNNVFEFNADKLKNQKPSIIVLNI